MDTNTYIALSRLTAQTRAMDVTAANIANAGTPGYRAERMQFSDWLSRQRAADSPQGERSIAYTQDRATWRDERPGTMQQTGNSLDLALRSDGYFTVDTARGPRLTRAGHFTLSDSGTVQDIEGNALLDVNGKPLQLGPDDTRIQIAGDGTISSENGPLGRIGIVRPADITQMQAEGGRLYQSDSPTAPVAAPQIVQGAVEDSNVQPILELTRMMADTRHFQFVSQFVQAEADRQQSMIDKVAQPAPQS